MKKTTLAVSIFVLALVLAIPAIYAQQQGGWTCPWMGGGQQRGTQSGGWYCPWMAGGMGYGRT